MMPAPAWESIRISGVIATVDESMQTSGETIRPPLARPGGRSPAGSSHSAGRRRPQGLSILLNKWIPVAKNGEDVPRYLEWQPGR